MPRRYTATSATMLLCTCPDCGAITNDLVTHDRWHDEIEARGTIGALWRLARGLDRRPMVR